MTTSQNGIDFIKSREGLSLTAYNDGTGWAIGYGNTTYENGSKVKEGDRITATRAVTLLKYKLQKEFEPSVNRGLKVRVTQNMFDALVSYAYNRGTGNFLKSKLLQMVNQNPTNPNIKKQFEIEWGTNTKYKTGLIARRKLEAQLYFKDSPQPSTASIEIWVFASILIGSIVYKNKLKNEKI